MATERLVEWRRSAHVGTWIALGLVAVTAACARAPKQQAKVADRGERHSDSVTTMNRHNTLEGREIDGRAVARIEELFVGRFPGVQVFQEAGGMTVRIRGTSTVNGNGEPLIILDDYQMSPGTGGLVAINPRDVARIEVLKDAVSMAQYGVLGANGIIRITTKKPK